MRRTLATLCLLWLPGAGFAADIQPVSGLWSGEVVFDSQTGCPAQMVDQMKQARPGYAGQQITFPDPFDPAVFDGIDANITWEKIAPNVWEGIFRDVQQTAMGTLTVTSKSNMTIIAPGQINQRAELTVELPQSIASSLGMATATCVVRSTVHHERTGS